MLPRHPVVPAAALFAAGCLWPGASPAIAGAAAAVATLLLVAALPLLRRPGATARRIRCAAPLVLAAFLSLGVFAAGAERASRPERDITRLLKGARPLDGVIEIEGSVEGEPRRRAAPEEGCTLEIAVEHVTASRARGEARGTVRLTVPPPPPDVADPCRIVPGSRVRAAATLGLPRSFANPGAVDYAAFLRARGIDATGRVRSARLLRLTRETDPLSRILSSLRRTILAVVSEAFEAWAPAAGERARDAAGIAKALLLGAREEVDPEAERALQRAGTSHLLAVSGFNVAVLSACVWWWARLARAGPRATALLVAAVLPIYLGLTGGEPSVERSVLGALLFVAGTLLGRRADPLATVGAAGLALLAVTPVSLWDVSFQLTFVAAGALAAFAARGARSIPGPRWLAAALAVNVIALAATTPLTVSVFNRAAPGAILSNLGASPLMAFAFLGTAAVLPARIVSAGLEALGVFFPPPLALDRLAAGACLVAIEAAVRISRAVAEVPGLSYLCLTPPPLLVGASLAGMLVAAVEGLARSLRRAAALLSMIGVVAIASPISSAPPGGAAITVLDVGQGSSAAVQTPGGRVVIVDGGGFARSSFDVGERIVARALLSMGIRRIDAIAVSHADVDHAGGLRSLAALFPGEELWISAADHRAGRLAILERTCLDRGRVLRVLASGSRFEYGGMRVEAMHPPALAAELSDNDRSLVLRFSASGLSAILPGDAEAGAERAVAPALSATDLLVVAHHGSRTSSTDDLLAAARPTWGVISCGARNPFGHPHVEALRRLEAAGIRILRTDRDGAIRFESAGSRGYLVLRHAPGGWRPAAPASLDRPERIGDEGDGEDDRREQGDGKPPP
jgi:competence protein ComEC